MIKLHLRVEPHKQRSMCRAKGKSTSFADLFHHYCIEGDRTKTPAYHIYQTEDTEPFGSNLLSPPHECVNFHGSVAKIQGEKSQDIKVTHYLKANSTAELSWGSDKLPLHVLLLQQNKSLPALAIPHYLQSGFSYPFYNKGV